MEVTEVSGEGGNPEYIAWDKNLVCTKYLEEFEKNKLISESAVPKVWMENNRFVKYSLVSFQSALIKVKNKYQFHTRPPTKVLLKVPKVNIEVMKKGPAPDPQYSSLFGTADGGIRDKGKGRLVCRVLFVILLH